MATAKRQPVKKPKGNETSALRLQAPSEALAALIRERSRLLKAIAKKQSELEAAREQQRAVEQSLFERMQPLVREHAALQQEISSIFQELLASGKLSKTARKKVSQIFDELKEFGDLDPIGGPKSGASEEFDDADFDPFGDARNPGASPSSQSVNSAKHAGGQPGNESLRGLFRRLTVALHPDLVQDPAEQQRRTEVMKDVTRAYEEGNLARLIEIEQLFAAGKDPRRDTSSDEGKCKELERAISELKLQKQGILAELKSLRAGSVLAMMFGKRRVSREEQAEQVDYTIEKASMELEPLREMRDFVKSFRDGKIKLAEFLRGPSSRRAQEFDIAEAMLEYVLSGLDVPRGPVGAPQGRKGGRKSKARRANYGDVPF